MASTYVNNLRLNEMATGDESGNWGVVTNLNLALIGQAMGYGTRAIANASTDNITIGDGASDADRAMYLKLTGGGQACTVTLLPNTSSKVWMMENATSYTLTFTCGSGANVAILAGETKFIATDGLGSGGVVYDVLTDVNLAGTTKVDDLTVGDDLVVGGDIDLEGSIDVNGTANLDIVDIDGAVNMATTALVTGVLTTTATQVATGGITSGSTIISDTDSTDSLGSTGVRWLKGWFDTLTAGTLTIGSGSVTDSSGAISFGDENLTTTGIVTAAGTSVFTNLDISGDVDVDGTSNLDIVDIDGAVDMASSLQVDGIITTSDGMVITTADNTDTLELISTDADANSGPNLRMYRNSGSPADADAVGLIDFEGRNDNSQDVVYAAIDTRIVDASDGTEDGRIEVTTILAGTAGVSRVLMDATETVFNDNSKDLDFRVESNGNAGMLFVDANDNRVGIGTAAPAALLHLVEEANTSTVIRLQRYESDEELVADDDIGVIEYWANDGSVASNATTKIASISCTIQSTALQSQLRFSTYNLDLAEHMRMYADGQIVIGTCGTPPDGNTSNQVLLTNGQSTSSRAATNLQTHKNFMNPNGTVGTIKTTGSATQFNTSSDYRLKENVDYTWDATTRLKQLKPARFNFIADDTTTIDGFLAHEVSSIVPLAISGEKDDTYTAQDQLDHQGTEGQPKYQGIDQSKLVPLMVKTIQELEARIAILESE